MWRTSFHVASTYPDMDHVLLGFNGSWTGSGQTLTSNPSQSYTWTFIDEATFTATDGGTASTVPDHSSTLPLLAAALTGLIAAGRRLQPLGRKARSA